MKDNINNNGPDIEKFLNYLDKETADKIRHASTRKKRKHHHKHKKSKSKDKDKKNKTKKSGPLLLIYTIFNRSDKRTARKNNRVGENHSKNGNL